MRTLCYFGGMALMSRFNASAKAPSREVSLERPVLGSHGHGGCIARATQARADHTLLEQ
jgi:hypothetical protein